MDKGKKRSAHSASGARADYQKLEDVIGCKWSVSVLQSIAVGAVRPGELERSIAGISTKALSERLRKLQAYGLISKSVFPEVPPHTEYHLTCNGEKLVSIIQQICQLDHAIASVDES